MMASYVLEYGQTLQMAKNTQTNQPTKPPQPLPTPRQKRQKLS